MITVPGPTEELLAICADGHDESIADIPRHKSGQVFVAAYHLITQNLGARRLDAVEQADDVTSILHFENIDDNSSVAGAADDYDSREPRHGHFFCCGCGDRFVGRCFHRHRRRSRCRRRSQRRRRDCFRLLHRSRDRFRLPHWRPSLIGGSTSFVQPNSHVNLL
jgi:hypothetical protein